MAEVNISPEFIGLVYYNGFSELALIGRHQIENLNNISTVFRRREASIHVPMSVGRSVGRLVGRSVFKKF